MATILLKGRADAMPDGVVGELEGIALAVKRSLRLAASLKLMRRAPAYNSSRPLCRKKATSMPMRPDVGFGAQKPTSRTSRQHPFHSTISTTGCGDRCPRELLAAGAERGDFGEAVALSRIRLPALTAVPLAQ